MIILNKIFLLLLNSITNLGAPQGVFALLGQGAAGSGDLSAANDYETVYSAEFFKWHSR